MAILPEQQAMKGCVEWDCLSTWTNQVSPKFPRKVTTGQVPVESPNEYVADKGVQGLQHMEKSQPKASNNPIRHNLSWPSILVKLPSDIPKFDGNQGDDPKNHVMTFHLWCSLNSLMDDSVRLSIFQRTLTGMAATCHIELPQHSFVDFSSLETVFLTHFQLPIHYEMGTDILNSLCQNTSTHISDHIHEWRR